MKKIRNWLIKKLGGYNEIDAKEDFIFALETEIKILNGRIDSMYEKKRRARFGDE